MCNFCDISWSRLKRRADQYLEVEENPASVLMGKSCCQRLLMIHPAVCELLIATQLPPLDLTDLH